MSMVDPSAIMLHHPVAPSLEVKSSVFADAAKRVLDAAPLSEVRLVGPYLAYTVVLPLVRGRAFRLLTDLAVCFDGRCDPALVSFMASNLESIRHLESVHAKVVLTDAAVLFGSANLTKSGFAERDELGCLLFDQALVQDVAAWFEELWNTAKPISQGEVLAAAERGQTAKAPQGEPSPQQICEGPVHRTLGWMNVAARELSGIPCASPHRRAEQGLHDVAHERVELTAQLRRLTRSRSEAIRVLDLLAHALRAAGLGSEDRRLHLNFGARPMSVTIGQRYVAWCDRARGQAEFGFILDSEPTEESRRLIPGAYLDWYRSNRSNDVPALHVPVRELTAVPTKIIESWERAIALEVEEAGESSFLRCKRPYLYRVLVDPSLRSVIAQEAHQHG